MQCITTGKLDPLIITGKPSDADLSASWSNLQDQYSSAVGDSEFKLFLNTYKELVDLDTQHNSCVIILHALKQFFYQPLLTELNTILGTNIKLDGLEKGPYYKQIDVLEKRIKGFRLRADLKRSQYKQIEKQFSEKGKKTDVPTREYFDGMLITLSDNAGYRITDQITVFEYCERIKRLNKQAEQINQHGRSKAFH